jgi:uncharacterized protein YbbK (DUF523 family)
MKKKLLVSACLLGINCRYDGKHNLISNDKLRELKVYFDLIPVCPEQLGGLSTPRLPAEIQSDGRILRNNGADVTDNFLRGADAALNIAEQAGSDLALLKAHSPSCGYSLVYSGRFDGTLIEGQGVTAKLFEKNGIKVYNEKEIDKLIGECAYV